MLTPVVADMAHFNTVDFNRIVAAGIHGVIHKATQGAYVDPKYIARRSAANEAGLMFGGYSFSTGDNVAISVAKFLATTAPSAATLMCLDYEDNPKSPMSAAQAQEFMDRVDQAIGRPCWIYGGNRILELITPAAKNSSSIADFFSKHPLWLCQYKLGLSADVTLAELNTHIHVPYPWHNYNLLQYTGDGLGPEPHTVDGVEDGADLNVFDGTVDQLRQIWAGATLVAGATPPPIHEDPPIHSTVTTVHKKAHRLITVSVTRSERSLEDQLQDPLPPDDGSTTT